MSMYRQLWLLLLLTILLSVVWGLSTSMLSARANLQEQLQLKNNDNASLLALALSQREMSRADMELTVAALFESGNYESIQVLDPSNKLLVERNEAQANPPTQAPAWLMALLPIAAPMGEAPIATPRKTIGSVRLQSQSRFAYHALWSTTWQMSLALGCAGLLSALLGSLTLQRIRRPLNGVIEQAQAIAERRFITRPESTVFELQALTRAMNSVVQRLKLIFEEEAARLEQVRQQANLDAATGLVNRSYFMARFRASLTAEESRDGSLLLLRVDQLGEINRRLGRTETDSLILQVSQALHRLAASYPDSVAGRLSGADFGLLLTVDVAIAEDLAQTLLAELIQSSAALLAEGSFVSMGLGAYRAGQDAGLLLAHVDAALAAAETRGGNAIQTAQTSDDAPRNRQEWGKLLQQAVLQRKVKLVEFPVVALDGSLLHSECPLRLAFSDAWLPAGQFVPLAERLELTAGLDLAALELGLQALVLYPTLLGLAINLSARSIRKSSFRQAVCELLERHPAERQRLWLEVNEQGAFAYLNDFHDFCHELAKYDCRLGVEHFGRQFAQIGQLHDLGLDYLKVDASFIREIESNTGNQAFLKGLCAIARSIDLQVIAEGVINPAQWQVLSTLGFHGVTGPGVPWPAG